MKNSHDNIFQPPKQPEFPPLTPPPCAGETLLDPKRGLCLVEAVEERDWNGETLPVCRIRFNANGTTMQTPAANIGKTGMRRLTGSDLCGEALEILRGNARRYDDVVPQVELDDLQSAPKPHVDCLPPYRRHFTPGQWSSIAKIVTGRLHSADIIANSLAARELIEASAAGELSQAARSLLRDILFILTAEIGCVLGIDAKALEEEIRALTTPPDWKALREAAKAKRAEGAEG